MIGMARMFKKLFLINSRDHLKKYDDNNLWWSLIQEFPKKIFSKFADFKLLITDIILKLYYNCN